MAAIRWWSGSDDRDRSVRRPGMTGRTSLLRLLGAGIAGSLLFAIVTRSWNRRIVGERGEHGVPVSER
jgi:hypothetical protein